MRYAWGIAAALLLSSCQWTPYDQRRKAAEQETPPPDLGLGELRDVPIPPTASEPPWRDLVRHTHLAAPGVAGHPAPSPDGKSISYATTEFGPNSQIALRDLFGAAPAQISANAGQNAYPRISPDGKLFAYASNRDGNWDIFVARLDAPMSVTQITFEPGEDIAPAWSPDGKKLVYSSKTADGVWQIVIADVASRVKTFLGPGLFPDWSPDSKNPWIAFQSLPRVQGGRSGVWVVRPDGNDLREIVAEKGNGWSALTPRFSPCGRWIAYATLMKSSEARAFGNPGDADDIWVVRIDGSYDMRLTDDLSAESWPAWAKDRVFFLSTRDGAPNIYSVRVKPLEDESE